MAATQAQHLIDAAAPYWAGEAEIVRTYLAGPRALADELRWLYAQAYKEAYVLLSAPREVRREFARTRDVTTHPDGAEAAERVRVEIAHFRLVADVIRSLWASVRIGDLVQFPEDRRLQALRREVAKDHGTLGRAVVEFTEGGGGAMYAVLAALAGDRPFDAQIATAFATIHHDELGHGPGPVHAVAACVRDARHLETALALVRTISRQRLAMRNEMFGGPLSDARLDAIANGDITPWEVPPDALRGGAGVS